MNNRKIVCIVGPTASGKTALGVELAKKFSAKGGPASGWNGAEIISADSRQVYKKLNIGTNKDLDEYDDIKYHLIDICDPGIEFTPAPKSLVKGFTLFDWLERAKIVIEDIFQRGKIPIVVGGTGLYVQSLVEGFAQTKNEKRKTYNHNEKLINYSREELNNKSLEKLQKIYDKLPTTNDKLDLKNPRRLIRAIEIAQEGTKISKKKPNFEALQIGITLPRSVLYKKIDKKVEEWFSEGILEEVGGLLRSGIDPNWLNKIGLNYRLIAEYLISGDDKIDKLKEEIKFKTHAYARRQITWFRRFEEIKWVKNEKEAEKLVAEFLN